jgi:hypothetical protein
VKRLGGKEMEIVAVDRPVGGIIAIAASIVKALSQR